MRHLGSLVAGLLIAPAAWLLVAAGEPRTADTFGKWEGRPAVYTGDLLVPLALVVGAGILVGLLGTLRWSPAGPLVAGVIFLAGYGWAVAQPYQALRNLPVLHVPGTHVRIDTATPLLNGTLAVLGAALVMAVFSAKRWRRWPRPVASPAAPAPAVAESPLAAPVSPGGTGAGFGGPTGSFGAPTGFGGSATGFGAGGPAAGEAEGLGAELAATGGGFMPMAPSGSTAEDLPRRIPQPAAAATQFGSTDPPTGGWPTLETLSRATRVESPAPVAPPVSTSVPPRSPLRKPVSIPEPATTSATDAGAAENSRTEPPGGGSARHAAPDLRPRASAANDPAASILPGAVFRQAAAGFAAPASPAAESRPGTPVADPLDTTTSLDSGDPLRPEPSASSPWTAPPRPTHE